MLEMLSSVIYALFGILCGILGWAGIRIYTKLDHITEQLNKISQDFLTELLKRDNLINEKFNTMDQRIIKLETRCEFEHSDKS